jgi:hypothetical protein
MRRKETSGTAMEIAFSWTNPNILNSEGIDSHTDPSDFLASGFLAVTMTGSIHFPQHRSSNNRATVNNLL